MGLEGEQLVAGLRRLQGAYRAPAAADESPHGRPVGVDAAILGLEGLLDLADVEGDPLCLAEEVLGALDRLLQLLEGGIR